MSETRKRDEKERDKALEKLKEIPATRFKAQYEDAYAQLCIFNGQDGSGAGKYEHEPTDLILFLRQEHEFWDQYNNIELKSSYKMISMLEKHLRANIKKKGWLKAKIAEQKDRTDLRKVDIPEKKASSPEKVHSPKKVERVISSPIVKQKLL